MANLKQEIINNLQFLAKYYKKTGDQWRTSSYSSAVISIASNPVNFSKKDTINSIKKIPNVGTGIAKKIHAYPIPSS